ncbi:MAG: hypothetical protein IT368_16810 [Candidatus Hydrogenedentes bacterium]|nr:hypothetical protein [Candidatus Hydrogenedentota bacterium]
MSVELNSRFRRWNAMLLLIAAFAGWIGVLTVLWTSYGVVLFIVLPTYFGIVCALVRGFWDPFSLKHAIRFTLVMSVLLLFALLLVKLEGMLCVFMAAPLVVPLMLLGTCIGLYLLRTGIQHWGVLLIVLTVPLLTGAAAVSQRTPSTFTVRSEVMIHSPEQYVWDQVIEFAELPPPKEFLFKTGIAYPIGARIEGHGVGAMRYCEFTTGDFVEPIVRWDEPNLLQFSVAETPPAMEEWGLFGPVDTAHLHGFFESKAGEFRIEALDDDTVVLRGTTHYQHGLWPESYWTLWSDSIIHRIHMRVLNQIKDRAEAAYGER